MQRFKSLSMCVDKERREWAPLQEYSTLPC